MTHSKRAALLVAVAVGSGASVLLGMGTAQATYGSRCSSAYGANAIDTCTYISPGSPDQTHGDVGNPSGGQLYDPVVSNAICTGSGTNCSTLSANSDSTGNPLFGLACSNKNAPTAHDYQSTASWNDETTGIRYTAIQSPFMPN